MKTTEELYLELENPDSDIHINPYMQWFSLSEIENALNSDWINNVSKEQFLSNLLNKSNNSPSKLGQKNKPSEVRKWE